MGEETSALQDHQKRFGRSPVQRNHTTRCTYLVDEAHYTISFAFGYTGTIYHAIDRSDVEETLRSVEFGVDRGYSRGAQGRCVDRST